jgi:hypothetical protein
MKWLTAHRQQPTFATKSALFGHDQMSGLSPFSGVNRKSDFGAVRSAFDPSATFDQELQDHRVEPGQTGHRYWSPLK